MRVAVDVRCLAGSSELKGISQYTRNLLSELLKERSVSFRLFPGFNHRGNRIVFDFFPKLPDSSSWKWSPVPMQLVEKLWNINWPPIEWFTGPIDILLEPDFFVPPHRRSSKVVTTIHDLSFQRHPEWFPKGVATERTRRLEESLRCAQRIIAVSEFTARELEHLWPRYFEKVRVIYEAAGDEFHPVEEKRILELTERLGLGEPFFLYTGTIEARKNIESLISAYTGLRRSGGTKCRLVLAGSPGYGSQAIIRAASMGIEKGWIKFIGYVKQEDLPTLYSAARALCYLSWYEGFGLPPLEALACGTPVLVSRIPVFEEILGPAACYADPGNEEEIARGLGTVEEAGGISQETRMKLASRYSWKRAASQTLALMRRIL